MKIDLLDRCGPHLQILQNLYKTKVKTNVSDFYFVCFATCLANIVQQENKIIMNISLIYVQFLTM